LGQDADFDQLGGWIEENIYDDSAGHIRLAVLWDDLLANVPDLRRGGVRALDVGGGSGRIAIRLARLGNEVVLCDPSREMLDRAEAAIEEAQLTDAISIVQARIQDLESTLEERFEVITCHAVLEWLAEPEEALAQLVRSLEPMGRLSLMFNNHNARLLDRVLRGDFAGALRDADPESSRAAREARLRFRRLSRLPSGWSRRVWGEEAASLNEEIVRGWLNRLGFEVQSKAGIRIFHDHLPEDARSPDRLDDLLAVENSLRSTEPFASLGKLTHLVAARAHQ
jgi:S-adenosylmethionine-dependent methyltransferase